MTAKRGQKWEILQEVVFCPLCQSDTNLSKVGFMGDYRYNRKRCAKCLLYFGGKEWKKRL